MPVIKDCKYLGNDGKCKHQAKLNRQCCGSRLEHYCPNISYSAREYIRRGVEEPHTMFVYEGAHRISLGTALWTVLKQTGHIQGGDDFAALIRSRSSILLDALAAVDQDREEIIWSERLNDPGSTWWSPEHYSLDRYKHILSVVANSKYSPEHIRDGARRVLRRMDISRLSIPSRNKRGRKRRISARCKSRSTESNQEMQDAVGTDADKQLGYVYVLKSELGYYKIGCTANAKRRLSKVRILLPFRTEVEIVVQVLDHYRVEQWLHTRFRDKRSNGEWFRLDSDDVSWLHDWSHKAEIPLQHSAPLFSFL